MKALQTIILAAGKGTRMNSSTPKVLHKICGGVIIQFVLDLVKSVGSAKTYIVLGHKSDSVRELLPDDIKVVEQPKLLGTADAVRCVKRFFKSFRGDILILNGDAPLLNKSTVKGLVSKHRKSKAACTFLTAVKHNPTGYGRIIRDEMGKVSAIREDKDASGFEKDIAEINVGIYCFQAKELFDALSNVKIAKGKNEYYLTSIIELLTNQNKKIETYETDDPSEGLGINTREDLAEAQKILQKRILKDFMSQGVTIIDPENTYVHTNSKIGSDTVIHPFSFIESDVKIGRHCQIGPFARLRKGTKIGDDVEIGNFTEVSRSKIGNRTLVKHFSFLGDSDVGAKVNIGAGTVTANFDGKDKNTTKISDNAFIGSDTILVAPVKVGKNSKVGAGSVVTQGKVVPDGAVAMGVPAMIISKKKKRKV